MSQKGAIMLGLIAGSIIGGYIPMLWGGSLFSYGAVFWSAVGSAVGIFIAYKMVK